MHKICGDNLIGPTFSLFYLCRKYMGEPNLGLKYILLLVCRLIEFHD